MITLTGIVIRERTVGEQDKFIELLTESQGVIEVTVRGARKITGKNMAAAQLFAYATFCMEQRRDRYYLNSAEPIRIFYALRQDLDKLALASYFADVLRYSSTSQSQQSDVLRLTLNTLHYLEAGSRPLPLLKALFELRLMTELGMMPAIVCCDVCGAYTPEQLRFYIQGGVYVCKTCTGLCSFHGEAMDVSGTVLQAIRHIVLSDFDRLFHFRIAEPALAQLSKLAERYLLVRLERNFRTLDFYKSLSDL